MQTQTAHAAPRQSTDVAARFFAHPWIPDAGDGTFRNPVIHADYSDPDVIRAGEDYWMTASSFNCTPGLPVLHSRDLVNWELVNHAIRQVPHPRYAGVQPGCGVWAPSIRHHAGRFWIFFAMPDEGIYVTCADDPRGAWCEPWLLQEAKGWIDPCPFWDDDGQAYLVHAYANSRAGKKERIHVRPMSPDCRRLSGEGKEVFHTPHHLYLEGPKVHKLNGWYYILAPGGGVPDGWQVAFRSRHIHGPYEEKVVLERGSTDINGPHQGALVDLPNGEWWFVHFQDLGAFGRVTHLQPVRWKDGWPLVGADYDGNGVGEPVASWKKPGMGFVAPKPVVPATSDEFDAPSGTDARAPGLQWQWHANHESWWADLRSRAGWLRLRARPVPGSGKIELAPHFLGQKFPARAFEVETLVDASGLAHGAAAGLAIVGGGKSAALLVRATPDGAELVYLREGRMDSPGLPISGACARLRARVTPDAECTFLMAAPDGEFASLPQTFRADGGGWIGAKAGLVAIAHGDGGVEAHADFDYFRFFPLRV